MKTLILIAMTILSTVSFAQENAEFKKCDISDLRLLEVAHSRFGIVKDVIREELLSREESCQVSKPRMIYPAVCGIEIAQIDTFKFLVGRNGARFEVKVDSSYISCQRTRALVIPQIRSLEFIDPKILPNM